VGPPPAIADRAVTGNALTDRIARRIRAEGPLTLAAYMAVALHDPELGYYATRQPLGGAGDFITAPEISQLFGELIGLWCAVAWEQIGRPDPIIVAELGPGSGALAADLLRAAGAVPEFHRAIRLYLVEASPVLREEQRRRLSLAAPIWLNGIDQLPAGPVLIVGNEFLDALPIRQLVRGQSHWAERMVALDRAGRLVFADGPENPSLSLLVPETLRRSAAPGDVFELCPGALALGAALGARLKRDPGAALLIDYGHSPSRLGASLSAVSRHHPSDPLVSPGGADLSAHVDFAIFAEAARAAGAEAYGPVPQGRLLAALGIGARLAGLSARATPMQRQELESGAERLLDPARMGDLFKAVALVSPRLPTPFGFQSGGAPL
jgi:NADH dehydrogenase [ubiquinone] 1 alpha subcomplex assembly factor 7